MAASCPFQPVSAAVLAGISRISLFRRLESKKKKSRGELARRMPDATSGRVRCKCGDPGATPVLSGLDEGQEGSQDSKV